MPLSLTTSNPAPAVNIAPMPTRSSGGDDGGGGDIFSSLLGGITGMLGGGGGGPLINSGVESGMKGLMASAMPQAAAKATPAPIANLGNAIQSVGQAVSGGKSPGLDFTKISQSPTTTAVLKSFSDNVGSPPGFDNNKWSRVINTTAAGQAEGGSPFTMAQAYLGKSEGRDTQVLEQAFKKQLGQDIDPTKVPWCAAFVNTVIGQAGGKGTGSLAAKSFLGWGNPTDKPSDGDIVVLNRTNNPEFGHVGFYAGTSDDGKYVKILGGNQDNQVSIKQYPIGQVAGYRQFPQMSSSATQPPAGATNVGNMQLDKLADNPTARLEQLKASAAAAYPDNPTMQQVAVTQAALESGLPNNMSGLAGRNNLFGIKGSGTAGTVNMPTKEYVNGRMTNTNAGFAANSNLTDSFNQHRDLMNKQRYASVLAAQDPNAAFQALQQSGYATDPAYAKKLQNTYATIYGQQ